MYEHIKKIITTIIGTGIMGFALSIFLVPLKIAPVGVSGLATAVNHISGFSIGVLIVLINVPLFVLGLITFNKTFLAYSVLGTISLSVSTELFSKIPPIITDPLSGAVFGGAILGLGVGIVIRCGGTTGGTDILAVVLKKMFPTLSVGEFFIIIDGVVIGASGLIFGSFEVVLYSVFAVFVSSKVLDIILSGASFANMVYIISDNSKEIADKILVDLKRGVTGLNSVSLYRGGSRYVLLCVLRKTEVPKLKKLVEETDESAFMIVSDAREVLGNGFSGKNL